MTNDQKIQRGKRALEILEDEVFQEAFDAVKERLTRQWIDSKAEDDRNEIWKTMKLLENVKWQLELYMEDGTQEKMLRDDADKAEQVIEDEKSRKKKYMEEILPGTRLNRFET